MLIDYHLHNKFSPDSNEETKNIIEKSITGGVDEICITNHTEWFENEGETGTFDLNEARSRFKVIKKDLEEMRTKYPDITIKYGVEAGYSSKWANELDIFINENDFDFVIGSVHIVNDVLIASSKVEYSKALYANISEQEAYAQYFANINEMVDWGHLDVIGHFDINKKSGHTFYGAFNPDGYKATICNILKKCKERDIGLEINVGRFAHENIGIFPDPKIIKWATEIGVKYFTLGSDAHSEILVGKYLKEGLIVAQNNGVKALSTYSNRKPLLCPL